MSEPYIVQIVGTRGGKTDTLVRAVVEAVRVAMPAEVIIRGTGGAEIECPCCGDWFSPCSDPDHGRDGMCAFCTTGLHDAGAEGCRN